MRSYREQYITVYGEIGSASEKQHFSARSTLTCHVRISIRNGPDRAGPCSAGPGRASRRHSSKKPLPGMGRGLLATAAKRDPAIRPVCVCVCVCVCVRACVSVRACVRAFSLEAR